MKASTICSATAALSRRLAPAYEPPPARESRAVAAAELAALIALAIVRVIFEILNAIFGVFIAPIEWACDRLLGPAAPTARQIAEAVVADPPPPPPVRVRPPTPIADLIDHHAKIGEFGWRGLPTPPPLPPDVAAWYASLRREQRKTAACTSKPKLEAFIAACRAGATATGPGDLPPIRPIAPTPISSYPGGRTPDRVGKGGGVRNEPGVAVELADVAAEYDLDLGALLNPGGLRPR